MNFTVEDFKENFFYRFGKNLGIAAALFIFVTLFYLILSYFNKMPVNIGYSHFLSAVLLIYIFNLIYKIIRNK